MFNGIDSSSVANICARCQRGAARTTHSTEHLISSQWGSYSSARGHVIYFAKLSVDMAGRYALSHMGFYERDSPTGTAPYITDIY